MVTVALAMTLSAAAYAQQQSAPSPVAAAREKIAAKDFDGAIAILEDFTKSGPPRPPALMLLAGVYAQKGDIEGALRTYKRVEQFPAWRAQAWFEVAAIELGRGEPDKALEQLHNVRSTGSFDFDLLQSDPRFESLRKDPRFTALIPKPADFEKPFVENVRVLYEIRGDTKNEQFGWIARRIGDVDGDRISDFATSAPTFPVEGHPAGRVFVYSGRTGKLLWQVTGKPGEQLGTGIEAAGDTDHDGIPDVIAGAPGSGYAYVYSGRTGKTLLTLGSGDANASFGRHTSTAGDVNGDGYSDVFVGAPGDRSGAGRATIYSGKDGSVLLTLDGEKAGDGFGSTLAGVIGGKTRYLLVGAPAAGPKGTGRTYAYKGLSTKPEFTFDSDDTGGAFGAMFMSIVGDVNGDGTPDFYVSDWANRAKGRSTGRIYVYSGKDGQQLLTMTGETAGDGFGIGVADAGDVDRDGAADLVVGAWQNGSAALSGGKVYVYSGKTQKLIRTITCRIPGDTFGFDTTNLGDVDGDGIPDFLITSAWSGVSGFQSGRLFVISGKSR
jgi:FG-GAP repeat protein/VCBS repeat protein